jgi:hypothetical protein
LLLRLRGAAERGGDAGASPGDEEAPVIPDLAFAKAVQLLRQDYVDATKDELSRADHRGDEGMLASLDLHSQ